MKLNTGRRLAIISVICLSLLLSAGMRGVRAQRVKSPNIIWIVCEDISPYIGSYGDKLVKTPNIDRLARDGVRYTHAYTTAGVCAPSRSAIITGMYASSIGTQHMRTTGDPKYQPVPSYSAVIPAYVKCFPELLRRHGYYCTNNEKQDYQFEAPVTVWDENGPAASFRNRPTGKPFFSVFNFFITHESQLFTRKDSLLLDSAKIRVPPFYPDTKTVRHDMDRLFTNIERMDEEVGELIQTLKNDNLYDNSIIFFYSDHGGALPWMKREILERGTHIPFIIHFPGGKHAGTVDASLISAVDFAPSILSLAGIPIPAYIQGQAFLGPQKTKTPRQYVYAARDRMDTEYDRVRMVRDRRFRYLFNYMPEKPYYQNIEYRLSIPLMREIVLLRDEGKLDSNQMAWFHKKPVEELYDVQTDSDELINLAGDPRYDSKLKELRAAFKAWTTRVGDMSDTDEKEMIKKMWGGDDHPPLTDTPTISISSGLAKIECSTPGASVGYRIAGTGERRPLLHTVQTWDYGFVFGAAKNGTKVPAAPVWTVYDGTAIRLNKGDTLFVNAMRIGYRPATVSTVEK